MVCFHILFFYSLFLVEFAQILFSQLWILVEMLVLDFQRFLLFVFLRLSCLLDFLFVSHSREIRAHVGGAIAANLAEHIWQVVARPGRCTALALSVCLVDAAATVVLV